MTALENRLRRGAEARRARLEDELRALRNIDPEVAEWTLATPSSGGILVAAEVTIDDPRAPLRQLVVRLLRAAAEVLALSQRTSTEDVASRSGGEGKR